MALGGLARRRKNRRVREMLADTQEHTQRRTLAPEMSKFGTPTAHGGQRRRATVTTMGIVVATRLERTHSHS
eukprot:6211199-Pleurochrysis_carterae.AAC.1